MPWWEQFFVTIAVFRFDFSLMGALAAVVWASYPRTPLAPFLGGMFDLTPRRAGAVALGASYWLAAILLTAELWMTYGPARLGLPGRLAAGRELLGVPFHAGTLVLGVLAGLVVGVLLVRIAVKVEPRFRQRTVVALVVGVLAGASTSMLAVYLGLHAPRVAAGELAKSRLLAGYLESGGDASGAVFAAGHVVAFPVGLVMLLAYVAGGVWCGVVIKQKSFAVPVDRVRLLPVPALAWVIGLLLVLTLLLNGAAFFCDGIHVGLLPAIVLGLGAYTATVGRRLIEPHTYRAYRQRTVEVQPAEVLAQRGDKAIVVCASGGGIHAAAWAAALLEKLAGENPSFRRRVALTSSVSGGSVGCFYFQASYRNSSYQPGELFRLAATSSLDFVAWGFAFRDPLRILLPIGRWLEWGNRAWALERAWRRFAGWNLDETLADWSEAVAEGSQPAAVFNATLVESGQRFAIGSVALANGRERAGEEFRTLYPDFTLRAATAANLSAAFPMVSPAAHFWTEDEHPPHPALRYHVVDGGYYDNYGVVSAVEFLENGLRGSAVPPQVLLVRIMGQQEERPDAESGTGAFFQLTAPVKGLTTMRGASQRARNEVEVRLLQERWAAKTRIETATFAYPHADAPLTWHLPVEDRRRLLGALEHPSLTEEFAKVKRFLAED